MHKQLKDALKIKVPKPVIGVENTQELHPLFYRQFRRYYRTLEGKEDNFNALVLSGLFLHLTLESYITWIIRWLLEHINISKNRRLSKVWEQHFENEAFLNKKIQFFEDAFLANADKSRIKAIKKFAMKLGDLRNGIVHGHEYSTTSWSNGNIVETKLAKLVTFRTIDEYYSEFNKRMKDISLLFNRIDMAEILPGIPSKDWVIRHLTFRL